MITTKLKKQCSTKDLLIEFSLSSLPPPLEQFYSACKEEGVQVRRDNFKPNQLNFYIVQTTTVVQVRGIKLNPAVQTLRFVMSVIYINSEADEEKIQQNSPIKRTLLLREGLDTKFYYEYEFENTQSELESVIYLCELATAIINSQSEKDICFYDQKAEEIKGKIEDNLREKLWRNIFFQIPGLGKEKCQAIVNKFPTYQSLLQDYLTKKQLKNVSVSKGTKEMKLGSILANRIYRCLFTEDGSLGINEE